MNEVVKMVSQKTGLDEAKSQQVVEAVMSFLRDKLPAPVAARMSKPKARLRPSTFTVLFMATSSMSKTNCVHLLAGKMNAGMHPQFVI